MFDFVEIKTVYLILHLIGVALGVGGAFVSDALYMASIRDKKITNDELHMMHVGGMVVWIGLLLLTISGLLLMSLNWAGYMVSTKFAAKMVIVLVIALNGMVVHHIYIPRMRASIGKHLVKDTRFRKLSVYLYISGAISFVSWVSTIVLGAFARIPYTTADILRVYLGVVIVAILGALLIRHLFLIQK